MASHFDRVVQEFHEKRLHKEIYAQQVRFDRLQELKALAETADKEMRKRRSSRRYHPS